MTRSAKAGQWLENVAPTFLECRDLHHSWKSSTVKRVNGGYERELVCRNCPTVKVQKLDRNGYVRKTRSLYPEGYLRPKGLGRITAAENAKLRLTNLRSQL